MEQNAIIPAFGRIGRGARAGHRNYVVNTPWMDIRQHHGFIYRWCGVCGAKYDAPQYTLAQGLFSLAALLMIARTGWWIVFESAHQGGWQPAVFCWIVFGSAGVLWYTGVHWVQGLRPSITSEPNGSPLHSPEPPNLTETQIEDAVKRAIHESKLIPEHQHKSGPLTPSNIPDPPEFREMVGMMPLNALKVYLGSFAVAATTKQDQIVLTMADRVMMAIHRSPGGLLIDTQIFGADSKILAELEKNVPYFNQKHVDYWRSERPDDHTIMIKDQFGNTVLFVQYLNPSAMRIYGVFRYSGRELVITDANQTLNGRPLNMRGVVSLDDHAMFGM